MVKKVINKKIPLPPDIRFVPVSVFQAAVSSIQAKIRRPYVEYLLTNNKDLLNNLIEFWKINRYKNFYLFKMKVDKQISMEDLANKIKISEYGSKEEEPIYDILRVTINRESKDVYIYLKIHSIKKHFKSEHYTRPFPKIEVDHRKPYFLNLIIHIEDLVLECRTKNFKRCTECLNLLEKIILTNKIKFELIKINNSDLASVDKGTKCTEAEIQGEWHGAKKIVISGDDVNRCIKELADRGADFKKDKLIIIEKKNESSDLLIISNSETGLISMKKEVESSLDPYRYLKSKVNIL